MDKKGKKVFTPSLFLFHLKTPAALWSATSFAE